MPTRPGVAGFRVSGGGDPLDWSRLAEMWAAAGESGAFDAGWMSAHLTDATRERGGGAFESITALAALSQYLPRRWVGVAVASNTFRYPSMLAKQASVLDNATGGRFVLGVGAGWHEGEHEQFGIPLPPMAERFERYEHAVAVLAALFSSQARSASGVTIDDPFYPLRNATLDPAPIRPEGPAIWLGGQRRRGIALAARYAEGWIMPGNRLGDVAYFTQKRDEVASAVEVAGRDVSAFSFAAQMSGGGTDAERREALETARAFMRAGATHVILAVPSRLGTDGVARVAEAVAAPLAQTT